MKVTFDLLKKAQGENLRNRCVVVGDFNFHSTSKKEEQVLTDNGFKDAMHDFVPASEPTMLKSKRFRAWRPDKVVAQIQPTLFSSQQKYPFWKVKSATIVGKEALESYKAKSEEPALVAQDGKIRTPSDHFGIVADMCFY